MRDVSREKSSNYQASISLPKIRYNDTIGGLHIVALDGTEYFRSESIHCDECLEYHIQTKDGITTHYVHRAVIAQKVGCSLKPIMAVERILKKDKQGDETAGHEGELTAAKRLALKVIELYGFSSRFSLLTHYTSIIPLFPWSRRNFEKTLSPK